MPTPAPQPFYTSRTFWMLVIAFVVNLCAQLLPATISAQVAQYANEVLAVLGIVFRWNATQPLALPGPGVAKTPPGE